MTTTHRTPEGLWALCEAAMLCDAAPQCELLFHFPDTTPEAMALLPEAMQWALCGMIEPPDAIGLDGTQHWRNEHGQPHRGYGLPAVLYPDGAAAWYLHSHLHRDQDLPALVDPARGFQAWFHNGMRHRDGGRPAVMRPDGDNEWWEYGVIGRGSFLDDFR